jgi:hypothetical protein
VDPIKKTESCTQLPAVLLDFMVGREWSTSWNLLFWTATCKAIKKCAFMNVHRLAWMIICIILTDIRHKTFDM